MMLSCGKLRPSIGVLVMGVAEREAAAVETLCFN